MEHADQVQKVITTLQAMVKDATKGALVMTYENVSNLAVGEVHILSADGTPYPQLVGLLVACMQGVANAVEIPMEQLMHDMAGVIDGNGIVIDSAGTVH